MWSEEVVQLLEGPEEIFELRNNDHEQVDPNRANRVWELRCLEWKLSDLNEEGYIDEADAGYVDCKEKLENAGTMNRFDFVRHVMCSYIKCLI